MDDVRPICEECERLRKEEASTFQSLQGQRHMSRQMNLHRTKDAKRGDQALQDAHDLAAAKARLHKAEVHKDGQVNMRDIDIVHRNGRVGP